jgi:hypothetical protein
MPASKSTAEELLEAEVERLRERAQEAEAKVAELRRDAFAEALAYRAVFAKLQAEQAKAAKVEALADRWDGYGHGVYNIHLEHNLPCSVCDLLAQLRAALADGDDHA